MKFSLNKSQAQQHISDFFKQKEFTDKELKKIKRMAMKFHISLKSYKKLFCKKCLLPLKGKTRITKTHKTIECQNCNHKNKWKIIKL
tara:strand:- start:133 stop:393 length:261 start_codon:yes stop_codon:yes gene_type:complete